MAHQPRPRFNARTLEVLGALSRRLPPSRNKNRLGRLAAYLLGNPPAAKGAMGDLRLWLRPADRTASEAFWSGCFDEPLVELLTALIQPGMIVVDAGANVGMVGLRLAARLRALGAGRVLCVEPIPANVRLLRASVQLNQLDRFCSVFEVGLADTTGAATLLAEGGHRRSGNAGLVAPSGRQRHLTKTTILLRTLDDLLHDEGDPAIDLMKLDVEGAELALLRGAARTIENSRPLIFGEFHAKLMPRQGGTFVDVMKLLAPFGYRVLARAGPRHLVEVRPQSGHGDVLLATPEKLPHMIAHPNGEWRLDLLR